MSKPTYNFDGEEKPLDMDKAVQGAIEAFNKELLETFEKISHTITAYRVIDLAKLASKEMEETTGLKPNKLLCHEKQKSAELEECLKKENIEVHYTTMVPEDQFIFVHLDGYKAPLRLQATAPEIDFDNNRVWRVNYEIKVENPYLSIIGKLSTDSCAELDEPPISLEPLD